MDGQKSSKRLLFLVFLISLFNFVVVLDMKVVQFSVLSNTTSYTAAQKKLRIVTDSIAHSNHASSNPQFSDLSLLINDLNLVMEGNDLVNSYGLTTVLVLSLITCLISAFAFLLPSKAKKWFSNFNVNRGVGSKIGIEETAMERAIADINNATEHLLEYIDTMSKQEKHQQSVDSFETQFDEIITLSAHIRALSRELGTSHDSFSEINKLLQKLSAQCGDNAHFASATRLEWNSMGHKLRQLREHHDKIKSFSDKTVKLQSTTSEKLSKSLDFTKIFTSHSENVRSNMNQLVEKSRTGYKLLDLMSESIKMSKDEVSDASNLVKGLSERAEAIVNIIDVIDDIAEQTNQLALNASIEAARAGEQGQGFAVVAGEVRNLAARSSTATKSITDLLGTIQEEADQASSLLEKSTEAVSDTFTKIRDVDQSYRDSLILSRHAISGLDGLSSDISDHFADLKSVEKGGNEIRKLTGNMNSLLEEHSQMSTLINSEGNQLTLHSDRMSRLVSRQYHEINHCQNLLSLTVNSVSTIQSKIVQSLANTENIKSNLDHLYKESISFKHRAFNHNVHALKNIEVLKGSSRTLTLLHSPTLSIATKTGKSSDETENRKKVKATENSKSSPERTEERPITSSIADLPSEDLIIGDKDSDNQAS